MREGRVHANGLEFATVEDGEGPLVLLLHGFPDNALTFTPQIEALAAAGYRAVAAYMRGYPPTQIPSRDYYDGATLAEDARRLIEGLGGAPAFVVGHDWGALTTYTLCAAYPDLVRRAVTIAVPHPGAATRSVTDYDQLRRSFYVWFFQLPELPEVAVAGNGLEFVERLWRDWSPGWRDEAHLMEVKRTLARPGAVSAALGYYRAIFDTARWDPALAHVREAAMRPISVPTLTVVGAEEAAIDPKYAEAAAPFFSGPYRTEALPGAGHFVHRERPREVNALILEWFAQA